MNFKKIVAVDETLLNEAALEQLKTIGEEVVVYHDFPTEEEESYPPYWQCRLPAGIFPYAYPSACAGCLPRNNYLLGEPEFALMGDRKILVNTSVGPTFEVDALKKWLGTCKHSYYLCDATGMGVARDALKDIPNVLYTPYISGKSIQSVERLSQKALANIRTFLSEAPQV